MCDIKNLLGQDDCADNTPGLKGILYFVPRSEFNGWPAVVGTTNPGESVTISTAFTFVSTSGKGYWRQIPVLIDENSYQFSMVGGTGSKSFEEKLNYTINGMGAAALEHVAQIKNIPGVFLAPDRAGVMHIVGTYDDPARLDSGEGTTGAAAGDSRNIKLVFRAVTSKPLIYTGTIDTTPNP